MSKSIAEQLMELAAELESRDKEIAFDQKARIQSAEGAHKELRAAWSELDKRGVELTKLRAQLDKAEGWIEWNGGDCPVDGDQRVLVRFRDADELEGYADGFYWPHDVAESDIIAYRLSEPAADPERPKTWRLLLDTLKRQGDELRRKDTIILAAHQQRDHYRQLAENAEQIHRDDLRLIAELRGSSDSWRRTADKLSAQLAHEKALSAARGKEIERLRAPRKMVLSEGRITWYDESGEIQSTAEGEGATMFDLLEK